VEVSAFSGRITGIALSGTTLCITHDKHALSRASTMGRERRLFIAISDFFESLLPTSVPPDIPMLNLKLGWGRLERSSLYRQIYSNRECDFDSPSQCWGQAQRRQQKEAPFRHRQWHRWGESSQYHRAMNQFSSTAKRLHSRQVRC